MVTEREILRALVEAQFPFFPADMQLDLVRIQGRNGGPARSTRNIRDLWLMRAEEISESLAFLPTNDLPTPTAVVATAANGMELTDEAEARFSAYLKEAIDFRMTLLECSPDFLQGMYRQLYNLKEEERLEDAKIDEGTHFFSHPEADARYDFWLRMVTWTAEEATALSFGKDPDWVNLHTLTANDRAANSLFLSKYRIRLRQVERAIISGLLSSSMRHDSFLRWMDSNSIEYPSELLNLGLDPGLDELSKWKKRCERAERELGEARRMIEDRGHSTSTNTEPSIKSLYRALLGIAIAQFNHRTDQKSPATKSIEDLLADLQMKDDAGYKTLGKICLSNDTIRSILDRAATVLEAEWRGDPK